MIHQGIPEGFVEFHMNLGELFLVEKDTTEGDGRGKARPELPRWQTEEVHAGADRACIVPPGSG